MNTPVTSENFLNDLLSYFQTQCLNGMHNLQSEALFLVTILGIIMLCVKIITEEHIFGGGSWPSYIFFAMKVGMFAFLVANWEEITVNVIFGSFKVAGQIASNYSEDVQPAGIFMTGWALTKGVIADILRGSIIGAFWVTLLRLGMCLAILYLFSRMAVNFFLVVIEFFVIASLSVILVPFGMVPQLSFLFDNVKTALLHYGVKFMTMIFIFGLGVTVFTTWHTALGENTGWEDLLGVLIGVGVYAAMVMQIPEMVSGMINGAPSHDSGAGKVMSGVTNAGATAARATWNATGGLRRAGLDMAKRGGKATWNKTRGARKAGLNLAKRGGRATWNRARQGGEVAANKARDYTRRSLANIKNKWWGK